MAAVVVTGVAGDLGWRVATRLAATTSVVGLDVVAPVHPVPGLQARAVDLAGPGGEAALDEAMDGAGTLVHLAWRVPDARGAVAADEAAAASENHLCLTRVLAAAAKAGVSSVVFVSSATVYGAWADNKVPLTEDAHIRPNPGFLFAATKAEAERVLWEWAGDHPAATVAVLRPAVTVGAAGRPLYQALAPTRSPRLGDEGRPVQYLHIDDLAAAVVLATEKRLSGVFNVAPDAGIAEERARELVGGVAKVVLPGRVAGVASTLGWRWLRRGVPVEVRPYATEPWVVAPDRLRAEGWVPAYTSEEALVATDDRVHWDDLPPGRRQNYNLAIALGATAALAGGVAGLVAALRRRAGRRLGG